MGKPDYNPALIQARGKPSRYVMLERGLARVQAHLTLPGSCVNLCPYHGAYGGRGDMGITKCLGPLLDPIPEVSNLFVVSVQGNAKDTGQAYSADQATLLCDPVHVDTSPVILRQGIASCG